MKQRFPEQNDSDSAAPNRRQPTRRSIVFVVSSVGEPLMRKFSVLIDMISLGGTSRGWRRSAFCARAGGQDCEVIESDKNSVAGLEFDF